MKKLTKITKLTKYEYRLRYRRICDRANEFVDYCFIESDENAVMALCEIIRECGETLLQMGLSDDDVIIKLCEIIKDANEERGI